MWHLISARRSAFGVAIAGFIGIAAITALAHPAAGIVVDREGNVFFVHTGRGVAKVDNTGKLAYIHHSRGGH